MAQVLSELLAADLIVLLNSPVHPKRALRTRMTHHDDLHLFGLTDAIAGTAAACSRSVKGSVVKAFGTSDRRSRDRRTSNRSPLLPLRDRLRVDPVALGQRSQALLTMLYRSTDRRRRRRAPMVNLARSASFHSAVKSAPSKPGIKQLGLCTFTVLRANEDKQSLPAPAQGSMADVPPPFLHGPREIVDMMREKRDYLRRIAEDSGRIAECVRITRQR